jgi:hypothetical protein
MTAPALGSERWNRCEKLSKSGPYIEDVAPRRMKTVVAPANAAGRKETSLDGTPGAGKGLDSMRSPLNRWAGTERSP